MHRVLAFSLRCPRITLSAVKTWRNKSELEETDKSGCCKLRTKVSLCAAEEILNCKEMPSVWDESRVVRIERKQFNWRVRRI